jgi:hypothetical protein
MTSRVHALGRDIVAWWPWAVPVLVAGFIYRTHGFYLERGIAALLALFVVFVASRYPDRSILVLIAGLPFQALLFAQLYAWGLPAPLLRPLAAWKEALALGVVVAGIRGFRAAGKRLDRLDLVAIAYVVIVGAYALLPEMFVPGAPTAANARSLAFRSSAGFVVLLLGARHARLPVDFLARASRVALAVGGVVASIAIYEYFFSDAWNDFVVDRVRYIHYQVEVLQTIPFDYTDIRRYGTIGGREVVRSGSLFLDPTPAGFYLVLPFAVAIERRLRGGFGRGAGASLVLIGGGLLLTQTRAALIAALVVGFLAVRPAAGRAPNRRLQFAFVFLAGLLVAFPAATATGLSERVTSTASGDDESSTDHIESFWNAVDAIREAPLGHGVGTSAGVGQRFASARTTISENAYLQVAIETGVIAMGVFVALAVLIVRRLNRAARTVNDLGIAAVRSAAIGLAVGALFLHTWSEFAVSWTMWALAGAAIGAGELVRRREPAEVPAPIDRLVLRAR